MDEDFTSPRARQRAERNVSGPVQDGLQCQESPPLKLKANVSDGRRTERTRNAFGDRPALASDTVPASMRAQFKRKQWREARRAS